MKILRHTYGRGFTVPVGPSGSFHTARAYRETTVEVEKDENPEDVIKFVEELVDAQIESDYLNAAGKNVVKEST